MSSKDIPLSVPHLVGNEWKYVRDCLDTGWGSYAGAYVDRFEKELAAKVAARFTVATSSGTAALHISLLLVGLRPEDEVIMPALTFVAPANAVRYCGAWPTFTDIRGEDWQWDIQQVADFLARECTTRDGKLVNKHTGRRIAALLPVHLLGGMCDVDAVAELATRYELPVVEDAAQCLGATYKERAIGAASASYGGPLRLVITSFNGNKVITTGGGGAIFTDNAALAERAKHLTTTAKTDKIEFFHDIVGYNYRLTNIAAALGVAQLANLDEFVEIKRGIAHRYNAAFRDSGSILLHPEPANCHSTFWMYTIRIDPHAFGCESRQVIHVLNQHQIQARPLWQPLYLSAAHFGAYVYAASTADELYRDAVSLPCSVGLTLQQQALTTTTLFKLSHPQRA